MTGPGKTLLTCTPSSIPRSENALAVATIAALIVPTAAYGALGKRAELPDISTTDPFVCLSDGQAAMISLLAPCSLSARPASHCSSVISNRSICGTAPRNIEQCVDPAERL